MIKKDSQPSAVKRVESEGRRTLLRAGVAAATVAALGGMPADAGSQTQQQGAKNALDALLRSRDAAKNPPPVPVPSPQAPGARPPEVQQQLAPMTLKGEGGMPGFNGKPVDLDSDNFQLKNAKEAYEEMAKLLTKKDDVIDFIKLYYIGQQPTGPMAAKKAKFEANIEKINSMEPSAHAEVVARLVRDMKALNDNGSKQPLALEASRAMFNVFPAAKNILVQFTQRPVLGSGAQANALDMDVDPNNIVPTRGTVRQYLKVHAIMKHKGPEFTGYANDSSAVDLMFANNGKQRSAGQGIAG